ncbi:MAG: hypothetical protein R3Y43_00740 [Alphaproteobacteria bacterium]
MKKLIIFTSLILINACTINTGKMAALFRTENITNPSISTEQIPLQEQDSVIVCRSKQCAPSKLSMSREYIHNALLRLFENNNKSTALICQASPTSKTCLENYITIPITVGIAPANMFIDSVKITDLNIGKGESKINLLLNYNVTFNGQSPDCTTANSIIYAKSSEHIILEDNTYQCKMTSVGKTNVSTVFAIDYIDLDYGFIGGYYSVGLSGPAYGGGTGYMLMRLMKDAYPLSPILTKQTPAPLKKSVTQQNNNNNTENVKVFPINKK